jgi:hypothetical protein
MRPFFGLLLGLLLALPAAAEGVNEADAGAIRGVIGQQLQAFQADDGNLAFSFAAPTIQVKFGDPGTFMDMVRSAYDPVYRPASVEFQGLALRDGLPVQDVLFVDRAGKAWLAHYSMTRMEDGSWRISGVWLEQLPDLST